MNENLLPEELDFSKYEIVKTVSHKEYGKIEKVKKKKTGKLYILISFNSEINEIVFNEYIQKTSNINHPCIINHKKIKNEKQIIMPFYSISLEKFMQSHPDDDEDTDKKLTFPIKLKILFGIASALKKLHSLDIVHGELNPSNIFINNENYPIISGFGINQMISLTSKINNENKDRIKTTKFKFANSNEHSYQGFKAPEIINAENSMIYSDLNDKNDIFSFGMLVYYMFVRKYPKGNNAQMLSKGLRPEIPKTIPRSVRKLISSCWSKNPSDRPDIKLVIKILADCKLDNEDLNMFMFELEEKLYTLSLIENSRKDSLMARATVNSKCQQLQNEVNFLKNQNAQLFKLLGYPNSSEIDSNDEKLQNISADDFVLNRNDITHLKNHQKNTSPNNSSSFSLNGLEIEQNIDLRKLVNIIHDLNDRITQLENENTKLQIIQTNSTNNSSLTEIEEIIEEIDIIPDVPEST